MGPAFGLQGDVQMNWGGVMDGSLFFQLHRGPVAYNSLSPSVLNGLGVVGALVTCILVCFRGHQVVLLTWRRLEGKGCPAGRQ